MVRKAKENFFTAQFQVGKIAHSSNPLLELCSDHFPIWLGQLGVINKDYNVWLDGTPSQVSHEFVKFAIWRTLSLHFNSFQFDLILLCCKLSFLFLYLLLAKRHVLTCHISIGSLVILEHLTDHKCS